MHHVLESNRRKGKFNIKSVLGSSRILAQPVAIQPRTSLRLPFIQTEGIRIQSKKSKFCLSHFSSSPVKVSKQAKALISVNILAGKSLDQSLFTREGILSKKVVRDIFKSKQVLSTTFNMNIIFE